MAVDMFLDIEAIKGEPPQTNRRAVLVLGYEPQRLGPRGWRPQRRQSQCAGRASHQIAGGTVAHRQKNDFFELTRREYSGLEGFCGALTVNCPGPAKAALPGLNDHEDDPLPGD